MNTINVNGKEYKKLEKQSGATVNLKTNMFYEGFWYEPVEEKKEWEILSLKSPHGNLPVQSTSLIEAFIKGDVPEYFILSVQRLSDGEIFTIGDKVRTKAFFELITIEFFKLEDGKIYINNSTVYNGKYKTVLKYISKEVKQPLFTTQDGKEIYEGDTFYYIAPNELKVCWSPASPTMQTHKDFKYFSTKELAEEHLLFNAPCLSLNDLLNVWGERDNMEYYKTSPMFEDFKKIAQQKLK